MENLISNLLIVAACFFMILTMLKSAKLLGDNKKDNKGKMMATLSLNQLKANIKKEQGGFICDFCKKKIDISTDSLVKTWIDEKVFHKPCYQKYRELK